MTYRRSLNVVGLALTALMGIAYAGQSVPDKAEDVTPLQVGEAAPSFDAQNPQGGPYSFKAGELDAPVVMIFYRGGWCPYCNKHLKELKDAVPTLKENGVEVLFFSADKPELLVDTLSETAPDYTLLSDASMAISRAFGIAFKVDDNTIKRYKKFGIDLEKASGFSHHQLPVPSVYVVKADGKIGFDYNNPDYKVRLSPEELLSAAGVAP
ncbi:MAG: peroxiredoxin-like family protein [Pseudomonadota bacterium]